jgi:hypothetical protein
MLSQTQPRRATHSRKTRPESRLSAAAALGLSWHSRSFPTADRRAGAYWIVEWEWSAGVGVRCAGNRLRCGPVPGLDWSQLSAAGLRRGFVRSPSRRAAQVQI